LPDILRAAANQHFKLAGFNNPMHIFIEQLKVSWFERKMNGFGFALI
jgi:hypothetical protein